MHTDERGYRLKTYLRSSAFIGGFITFSITASGALAAAFIMPIAEFTPSARAS